MSFIRARSIACCAALTLLAACASEPVDTAGNEVTAVEPDPELTLNLPQQPLDDCLCEDPGSATYFDRGFSALAYGEYVEAVGYFQRYQRTTSSAVADWEAEIAIAYVSMLPQSPFYDPQAARRSYRRLDSEQPTEGEFNEKSLMMRDTLSAFDAMQGNIEELRNGNAKLVEDLEKREEALRRLRELTLGQKGAAQ